MIRTLDRCVRERKQGADSIGDFFGYRRTIYDLESHAADLNLTKREKATRRANYIFGLVKEHVDTSRDQVFEILLKCRINKITLLNHHSPRFYCCGSALYLAVSKMNHSCVEAPYVQIFDGRKYTLRALRDIRVDNPLTLTVHYVPPNMPFAQRQKHLLHNYYFICNCAKCCWQARHPIPEADEAIVSRIEKTFQTAPDYNAWYNIGKELLAKLHDLPDSNFYVNWLLTHTQWTCTMVGHLEESIYYGSRALRSTDIVTTIETILFSMCESMIKLGWHKPESKKQIAFGQAVKLAKSLFVLTHGANHKLYRALESMQKAGEDAYQYAHQAGDFQRGNTLPPCNPTVFGQSGRPRYAHSFPGANQLGDAGAATPSMTWQPWMTYLPRLLASVLPPQFSQVPSRPCLATGNPTTPRCPIIQQLPRFPSPTGRFSAPNPPPIRPSIPIRQLS